MQQAGAVTLLGQFALHETRRQVGKRILSANADSKIVNGWSNRCELGQFQELVLFGEGWFVKIDAIRASGIKIV